MFTVLPLYYNSKCLSRCHCTFPCICSVLPGDREPWSAIVHGVSELDRD